MIQKVEGKILNRILESEQNTEAVGVHDDDGDDDEQVRQFSFRLNVLGIPRSFLFLIYVTKLSLFHTSQACNIKWNNK
jgi:hypothetical protein